MICLINFFFSSKIEKEEKNKQRMFDERIKVEEQLNRVILNLDKVIRFNEMTQKDHEAEMKRIGSKEEILKVEFLIQHYNMYFDF